MTGFIDPTGYRRLTPPQRDAVDRWLDEVGIEAATRIARGQGSTVVWVARHDEEGQPYTDVMVVKDPPFPWSETVLQLPG